MTNVKSVTPSGQENSPLITVIIPAYNAAPFLQHALRSATSQTYRNMEILVVNDGSTDSTVAIVESEKECDSRIQILHKKNGGLASARNFGLVHARGRYVAFLDADDIWHPDKLRRQLEVIQGRGGIAAVYALFRFIDAESRVIGDHLYWDIEGSVLARHLMYNFVGCGSSLLCIKEAALDVGGFDVSYHPPEAGICEDYDFQLKLAAKYSFGVVSEYLVGYRKYSGTMSTDYSRRFHSLNAVLEHHLRNAPWLSKSSLRLITGSRHVRHTGFYLKSFQLGRAMLSALFLLRTDPLRFAVESLWRFPHAVIAGPAQALAPQLISNQKPLFAELNPAIAKPERHIPFTKLRLSRLARDDTRRESAL